MAKNNSAPLRRSLRIAARVASSLQTTTAPPKRGRGRPKKTTVTQGKS
ncbi:4363_t:CDS:2 [Diversispora eburnea]|uniref:4363_t:CDS:1 n=1 Tax=Diversispora eburnea TaxID=1213867 RepID=A0A9N9F253_9GLOM|nr:4363_t:CDS:2 [Diversispora eburnea]